MKKAISAIIPLLFACIVCSCTENKENTSRLQAAEGLMEHRPDSALSILEGIKTSGKLSEGQNALWCLLTTQAQDKTGTIHTSDSLIRIAVRYYEKKKDRENRMKAYYYNAVVHHDLGDSPRAQDFYLKAWDAGKETGDHALLGRICANLGTLYLYQNMTGDALKYQKNAVKHFTAIKDTTSIGLALRNIGRVYTNNELLDSAIIYYTQSLNYVTDKSRLSIHNDVASLYNQMENYPEAFMHIRLAMEALKSGDEELFLYYNLGDLYRKTGQYDSAVHYLSPCLTSGNIHTKAGANLGLALLEEKRQNWEANARYQKQYRLLQDSIVNMERSRDLQRIQSLYNYQQVEKGRIVSEQKAGRRTFQLYALLAIVAILVLSVIVYYQRRKRIEREKFEKKLRMLEQQQYEKTQAHLARQREMLTTFRQIPLYGKFSTGKKVNEEDWIQLKIQLEKIYPDFTTHFESLSAEMDEIDIRLSYLTKINLPSTQMSTLLSLSKSAITKRKQSLYKKITKVDGNAKGFDIFMIGFQ